MSGFHFSCLFKAGIYTYGVLLIGDNYVINPKLAAIQELCDFFALFAPGRAGSAFDDVADMG
jgi:hypothetical protein